MKKISTLGLLALLLFSCGNTKQIQQLINTGNYDSAIDLSVEKLIKKKGRKSGDPYILLLKDAYDKATNRDVEKIARAKKDVNPEKWQTIYDTYLEMDSRQNKVKSLLPLLLAKSGKEIKFELKNYDSSILDAKNHFVNHLYKKAKILLNSNDKKQIRQAYDILDELDRIDPNFKDVRNLMSQAHQRGMTYALVEIVNNTNKIIPKKLQNELLNFSSYGASNFWVDYHNKPVQNLRYDYDIKLRFTNIAIGPDQQREKEIVEERDVQDGYTYQKDANGNIVKDTLGKPIKIPRMIHIRSNVHLFQQHKEAGVQAQVDIIDKRTGQKVDNFPLQSKYVFDYNYATYQGDRRAIRKEYQDFLDKHPIPYPTNEQMIYDASQDIKMKFKDILNQASFL